MKSLDFIEFSEEVKKIFSIFPQKDSIRLVGGCVRDLLLKNPPKDFDFATKKTSKEILEILKKHKIKSVETGIKYGTVIAVINQKNFEITTLRKDVKNYGRKCDVEFVDDYFLDAKRRDFTINALYLDENKNLYDYFGGVDDLKKYKVKFIGNAKKRIKEDYLRVLRFFRFSCQYAKKLDKKGLEACLFFKKELENLSKERIRQEFFKLILSDQKKEFLSIVKTIDKYRIFQFILLNNFDQKSFKKLLKIEEILLIEPSLKLRIASLCLHKEINLEEFYFAINATKKEKKYWNYLYKNFYLNGHKKDSMSLKKLNQLLAFEDKNLVTDFYLFNLVKIPSKIDYLQLKKDFNFLEKFILPKFPINSKDIINQGFKGSEIGKRLKEIKIKWAENNFSLKDI